MAQAASSGSRQAAPNVRTRAYTPEAIARAGLELLDRDGLEALSMRRLARETGMGTMTLYGYFHDKGALLDAIVDAAAAEHHISPPAGSWQDQLMYLMREFRATLEQHPGLIRIRRERPMISPGILRGEEVGLRAMLEAGFTRADAARSWRTLFVYTIGFVAFSSAADRLEEGRRQARAAVAVLPPEDYPSITAMIQELPETMGGDEQFEFGLRSLVTGYKTLLGSRVSGRKRQHPSPASR